MSREDDEQRCPFCHEWVAADRFERHVGRHQERRADGQMRGHVTLPPEDRRRGRLDGVPTVYVHRRCGEATRMPDDVIRSYLKNPFLYNGETFCCGCNAYVPWRQCRWEDTGQPLDVYFEELRAEARRAGRGPTRLGQFGLPEWLPYAACGVLVLLGLARILFGLQALARGAGAFVLVSMAVGGLLAAAGAGGLIYLYLRSHAQGAKPRRRTRRPRDDDDE
ncbi:MAG: hypothetical protein U0871_23670 [Gemmataceae bacterium]